MDVKDLVLIDVRQLPHSLQALIDCIGLENAYRLTREYGGPPSTSPSTPNVPPWL